MLKDGTADCRLHDAIFGKSALDPGAWTSSQLAKAALKHDSGLPRQ